MHLEKLKVEGEKLPAIAVSGPFGAVKEQSSGLYAMQMAERGFMAAVDFLYYINEIRSAVLVMHGAEAHSRYFGEAAYHYMVEGKAEGYKFVGEPNPNPENKQLLIIPEASHCDLYDGGYEEKAGHGQPKNMIPWDTLAEFFTKNLK